MDAVPLPNLDDMVLEISKCKYFSAFDLKSAYHQVPLAQHERTFTAFEANGELLQFTRLPFGVTNGVSAFQRTMDGIIKKHNLRNTWAYLDNVAVGGIAKSEHDDNVRRFSQIVYMYNLTLNHAQFIISVTELCMVDL